MRRLIALFLAFAMQAAPCAAEACQIVKPDGLGFAVELPRNPNSGEQAVDLGGGASARMRSIQIQDGNVIYDVTVADYPQGMLQSGSEEQSLDNARDGALRNAPGPLKSETKIDFAGRRARDLIVEFAKNTILRSRIFLVGDRLFNVAAITYIGNERSAEIEKYFASFKLLDEPAGDKP